MKVKKYEKYLVLVAAAASLILLILISRIPLIPQEGDPFGCWQGYVSHWKTQGLGSALAQADAPGRYPGYPFVLMLINFLSTAGLSVSIATGDPIVISIGSNASFCVFSS